MNISLLSVRKHFKKKVALALGISGSGGSLGTMIFGPVLQALVDSLGWRNALRVIAIFFVAISLLMFFFETKIESRLEVKSSKEEIEFLDVAEEKKSERNLKDLTDCSIWKSPKYTVGTIAVWLTFFGLYVPMIHMVSFYF